MLNSMLRHMINLANDFERSWAPVDSLLSPLLPADMNPGLSVTDAGYELEVAVPGMRKEHVQITVEGDASAGTLTLYVSAERSDDKRRAKITRSALLPQDANADTIKASVSDGILLITMERLKPQPEKPNARTIRID